MRQPEHIGGVVVLDFPELAISNVKARVDTGATSCSIWAKDIKKVNDGLEAVLCTSKNGQSLHKVLFKKYESAIVKSANGSREARYKVPILVQLKGRKIRVRFTLSDRTDMKYSVLVGRNMLRGKFIVDLTKSHKEVT